MLQWFKSYLMHRKSFVPVYNMTSKNYETNSGVPQRSVLGPLIFFFVFVNNVLPDISHSLSLPRKACF